MSTDAIGSPTLPLQNIVPSYLYFQFSDDADLQAFVNAYNSITQGYLDWFNDTPLALYTSPNVAGPLLDWIGQGIYGVTRPTFSTTTTKYIAGMNARPMNTVAINGKTYLQSGTATTATDDYYRRVLTWFTYTGNGRLFNVIGLRQKVARFLYGTNGSDISLDQAQNVHITLGALPLPPAPTLSYTSGGSLPIREYGVRATYQSPVGEGLAGPSSSITVPANNVLVVDSPPVEGGAIGWSVYADVLSTNPTHYRAGINANPMNAYAMNSPNHLAVSAMTKQNTTTIALGTNWTEPTSGLIVGAALPVVDHSNTGVNYIITVPASQAATIFSQAMNQGILTFPFQLTASVIIS